jgi:2-octaprenyl-6-methoxyphenol hydroxylase
MVHWQSLHDKAKFVRDPLCGYDDFEHNSQTGWQLLSISLFLDPASDMNATSLSTAEVAVIGAGPAGLVSAIALQAAGVETLLIAPPPKPDHRTTALLAGSVTALETLGAWERCRPHAAPLRNLRISDVTQRLLRAPEVFFSATEIGRDAFGYNIENSHLIAALRSCADEHRLPWIAESALAIARDPSGVTIKYSGGEARVKLAIGADGSRSACRAACGIATQRRPYSQTALTANFSHSRRHGDTSSEFHTEQGPFTLVPLPGRRSSLVCVLDPTRAVALAAMSDAELSLEIERRAHSLLGKMTAEPGRGLFPLAVEAAQAFARDRIALVGEAAHVVPPIGAQGLNLGLRDGATVAELVAEAHQHNRDVGAPELLERYDSLRRADIISRTVAVDVLNRSLLTDFMPAHGVRGLSLYIIDHVGPLRRALMREGVMPTISQPKLMRGEMV